MILVRRQSGIVLAVTLFMLALLTIIGVSAVMVSTTHFRLVGNIQASVESEKAMHAAIETLLDCPLIHKYATPPQQCFSINGEIFKVIIDKPVCIGSAPPAGGGYSLNATTPQPFVYELRATAFDSRNSKVGIGHWGVLVPPGEGHGKCSEVGLSIENPCPTYSNPNPCP